MNYKSLTIIALALCLCVVPTLAAPVWSAGNYVTDGRYDNCDSVKYNPQTDVYSCYRDNNPVNEIRASENGNGGTAEGSIRAGYSTLSDTIYVRNVLQDKNGTPMVIKVNPDAKFRIPAPDNGVLAPGKYRATLDNYDLDDETVEFEIAANQQGPTYISFIGQAASQPAVSVCQRSILKASYGKFNQTCYGVVVTQGWTEHFGKYNRFCDWGWNGQCYDWDYVNVGQGNGDYTCKSGECYRSPVVHPTTYRQQCDTNGVVADVTSNVREALSQGYTKFLFDNSAPHHGIYDITTTTLLSSVDDPAEGIVKDVSITYTTCSGVEQMVQGKEYQAISLN